MKQKPSSRRKCSSAKSVLRLPELEQAKAAVFNSLNSAGRKGCGVLVRFAFSGMNNAGSALCAIPKSLGPRAGAFITALPV
jgi:hypothetical protein